MEAWLRMHRDNASQKYVMGKFKRLYWELQQLGVINLSRDVLLEQFRERQITKQEWQLLKDVRSVFEKLFKASIMELLKEVNQLAAGQLSPEDLQYSQLELLQQGIDIQKRVEQLGLGSSIELFVGWKVMQVDLEHLMSQVLAGSYQPEQLSPSFRAAAALHTRYLCARERVAALLFRSQP